MQSKAVDPVRIVLFTAKHCYQCPEVNRIVHKVVGSAMGDSIHVITVDVDEQPTVATKYDVSALPTILIDEQIVLSGVIEEDQIKTKLWETLINRGRRREWIHDRKKESMIQITMNMLNSVTRQELIREDIGDYCHLGHLQQSNLSLLRLDPHVSHLLYRVGKDLGMYGAFPAFVINANPRIGPEYRVTERFEEIMQGIVNLFSEPERFPTFIVESAELIEMKAMSAVLRVYGSSFSVGIPGIGEPVDYTLAGIIAGIIEALLGKHVQVVEHNCWGLGERYCDFHIDTAENPEELPPITQKLTSNKDLRTRRYLFHDAIIQSAKQMDESIFMKKQLRTSVGDYCHIGIIQQPLTALKWLDPFCGTLLYSAGFELGIYGPGKEIISNILLESKKEWFFNLPDAVEAVQTYWYHPLSILSRQHAFIEVVKSKPDKVLLQVKECAAASGLPHFRKAEVFCDFQAGYLGGRVDLLTEQDIVVRELECHGTGHNHCLFEITHV